MRILFPCYYLPEEVKHELSFQTLLFKKKDRQVELEVPIMTPEVLSTVLDEIKAKRKEYLQQVRTSEIVEIIDKAVQRWLNPAYEKRQLAEEWLPIITGYDQEMIHLFISKYLRNFRQEKLLRMIDQDFPNPLVLDEFRPRTAGGLYRAYGPELITHIFSGNVPALPLWSMISGILLKSATLGKVSSAEPLFPVLFAQTLAEIEPRLAQTIAIAWWKGGEEKLEEVSYEQSEAVIAYGSAKTIENIARNVPAHVRFYPHGHKVSFGVITNECLEGTKAWETAHLAAHDASWFDQQGCLSAHLFFVEQGGKISARDFAHMLAQEMANFERKMPRAPLSVEENQAILQARSQVEFRSFDDKKVELLASEQGTSWTVIYQEGEDLKFPFSVLNRVIRVLPIHSVEDIGKRVTDMKHLIQTVGVASTPQKFRHLINLLGEWGVNRICSLGEMPSPEPGWHHDGRLNLADMVRWCDVESSLERNMDKYDPYRD